MTSMSEAHVGCLLEILFLPMLFYDQQERSSYDLICYRYDFTKAFFTRISGAHVMLFIKYIFALYTANTFTVTIEGK